MRSYTRYGCALRTSYDTPAAAQQRTRQPVRDCLFLRKLPDSRHPVDEDAIAREQLVAIAEDLVQPRERRLHPIVEIRGQIMRHAADAAPGHSEPRAGDRFDQVVQQLARLEHVEGNRRRTDFARRHPEARQVVGDARDFAHDHAHVLASLGRVDADQALDREREADVVDAGRRVIQPVGVREALRPGSLLAHLFESAMQVSRPRRRNRRSVRRRA